MDYDKLSDRLEHYVPMMQFIMAILGGVLIFSSANMIPFAGLNWFTSLSMVAGLAAMLYGIYHTTENLYSRKEDREDEE